MTKVTCRRNLGDPTIAGRYETHIVNGLRGRGSGAGTAPGFDELVIQVEVCPNVVRAAVRLAQDRFDLIIIDCAKQSDVISLLQESRSSIVNANSLAVVVVEGQETSGKCLRWA